MVDSRGPDIMDTMVTMDQEVLMGTIIIITIITTAIIIIRIITRKRIST